MISRDEKISELRQLAPKINIDSIIMASEDSRNSQGHLLKARFCKHVRIGERMSATRKPTIQNVLGLEVRFQHPASKDESKIFTPLVMQVDDPSKIDMEHPLNQDMIIKHSQAWRDYVNGITTYVKDELELSSLPFLETYHVVRFEAVGIDTVPKLGSLSKEKIAELGLGDIPDLPFVVAKTQQYVKHVLEYKEPSTAKKTKE